MEDLTGRQFGRYQIVAPLGEGGMAAVYKAYQPSMERHVAIKVLPRHMATSEEFLNRFRREAKILAQLQHPNILPVFDYGESEDYPYIVMPFVSSGTLAELMKGRRLPLTQIRRIITQIGDALGYAHAHGMIHRDIKPSNVLVDESGNCLLTDFGLARMVESSSMITSSGAVMGTPAYMSPEQGSGNTLDHRSDIYSLGIILYEMLTGRVPYSAETPIAVVIKHIQDPLPSIRKIDPSLPESIELIVLKSMAKNPDDRYQTAEEFVTAIQVAITEVLGDTGKTQPPETHKSLPPVQLKPVPVTAPPVEKPKAQPAKFLVGGALVVCILLGLGGTALLMAWQNMREDPATATAPPTSVAIQPAVATPTEGPTDTPSPIPSPSPTEIPPVITAPQGMTMVLVPAGKFTMGNTIEQSLGECVTLSPDRTSDFCQEQFFTDETPAHQVYLDAYYIDQYEVTNASYKQCVDAGSCRPPQQRNSQTHDSYYGAPAFDNYPVIWVDWGMAKTYCEWRGARLPTEAEWEKAARGETPQAFPWGNSFSDTRANACDRTCPDQVRASTRFNDGFAETAPVDSFPDGASVYGVFNLAGNVSEWVSDWYHPEYYMRVGNDTSNPFGPPNGEQNIIRGGSWNRLPINLRTVTRAAREPNFAANDVGLRCVAPLP